MLGRERMSRPARASAGDGSWRVASKAEVLPTLGGWGADQTSRRFPATGASRPQQPTAGAVGSGVPLEPDPVGPL
jgi:hypothetical protein